MKKIKLIISLLCFYSFVQAQVISGTVIDQKTKARVAFAAIYFNGTFVGTTSDIDGNFTLDVSKNVGMPLSVSCMGYYSQTLPKFSFKELNEIYLEPKQFAVDEVVVAARSMARKRISNLRLFKKEFLGSSVNAQSCEIVNEEDIYLKNSDDGDTLFAYAVKPIQIRNKALGYVVDYYLDQFEYYRANRSFIYQGNIVFAEDLLTNDESLRPAINERRKAAYLGSRMHFLRILWANELESSGFGLSNVAGNSVAYNHIVVQEMGNVSDSGKQVLRFLSYPLPVNILYNATLTTLTVLNQRVYFDKTGYHGAGLLWEGEMLKKRIGDALPYEYQINTPSK